MLRDYSADIDFMDDLIGQADRETNVICIIKLITAGTLISGRLAARRGTKKDLSCIFGRNERSVTRSAPLSPREISVREPADDRGVHEVDLRDQDVENVCRAWQQAGELRGTLCLSQLLDHETWLITIVSIFPPFSTSCWNLNGSASLSRGWSRPLRDTRALSIINKFC